MDDFTANACQAEILPARVASGFVAEAMGAVSAILLTATIVIVGTALVAAALVVGVVGSPLVAAAIAWVLVRHRRLARVPAVAPCAAATTR